VHGGCRVLHALPSVSLSVIADIVCGVWNTAHRSGIVVATFPRPSPRFMSTTRRTTPPPERPTTPPSLGSAFHPLELLYVNKLPLVAALLAGTVPGTLERIAAVFILALCMRRAGKTSIILLMKYAATGDRSALRWLLDDPAVKVFMEKPGPNGFQLFTTTLPVIHLDFSAVKYYEADDGSKAMVQLLRRAGRELGVDVKSADDDQVQALKNLVEQVREKYVTPVDEAAVQDAVSSGGAARGSGVAVVPSRRLVSKRNRAAHRRVRQADSTRARQVQSLCRGEETPGEPTHRGDVGLLLHGQGAGAVLPPRLRHGHFERELGEWSVLVCQHLRVALRRAPGVRRHAVLLDGGRDQEDVRAVHRLRIRRPSVGEERHGTRRCGCR
jgi:hypothetical protein